MNDQTDQQLLRDYAERQSEAAFAELVRRHVDLVYSAAMRMVGDPHLAKDVTQAVFVALAQNARQLTDHPVVSGWLHRTAQNIASKIVRTDVRRRAREQEAVLMNELLSAEPNIVWEHIAPHLDAALGELSEPDRGALFLRYFERKSAREMAQTLGISDDAAQKRVSRAIERLREFFAKRGVTVGASGLAVVISANAVQAAPVGLALTISTAAVLTGTTLATTATATAIKTTAMTAFQKTIVATTIAVLAGAGIYEARQASQLREQNQTLQQQQTPFAAQLQQLQRERDEATNRLAVLGKDNERLKRNTAELLKLRARVTSLLKSNQELTALTNDSSTADSISVDERDYAIPDSWANAGLETPTAAIRTYLWAMSNTNIAKLKEVLSPPIRDRDKDAFWELLDKQGLSMSTGLKGARVVEAKRIGDNNSNECLFMIEIIEESTTTTETGDPLGLMKTMNTQPVILRRTDGVWRVAMTGNRELSPEEIAEDHAEAVEMEKSEAPQ
ncbi:MAG: hypothetical protein QOD03_1722 [Verrucomicrobiota bacterium]